jgi:hypothetical protein
MLTTTCKRHSPLSGAQTSRVRAGEKVRSYYHSIGFGMPSMLARTGIKAALGYYSAPVALQ